MRPILRLAAQTLLVGTLLVLVAACARPSAPAEPSDLASSALPDVVINELRIDQSGTDVDEFFELAGPGGASLDGLTYLVIGDGAGGSGVVEAVVDLTGQAIPGSGHFVAAESTFTLGAVDLEATLDFENSDNVTHLLVAGFTAGLGDDLDTNDDGVLDVEPWASELDRIALVEQANPPSSTEYHYGPPSVGPDGSFVPGHAYRCGDDWVIGAFAAGPDTPGAPNPCDAPPSLVCGAPATLISAIQGSGSASPRDGDALEIEAVVVGDFQANDGDAFGTDLDGFFVQEEDADSDGDPATSEGLFVFAPDAPDVGVGDRIRVAGTVDEYGGLTELTNVTSVLVCGSGEPPAPTDVALPWDAPSAPEAYEGMLVRFPQELVISEYFDFDRYGEMVLSLPVSGLDRPFQTTSYLPPADAAAEADALKLRRVMLDDGRSEQNPDLARHPNGDPFTLANRFRGGDVVQDAVGVMHEAFGGYRLQPTGPATYSSENPRPTVPDVGGGEVRAAVFNVLNYFTTLDARGADTLDEFKRQRAKIFAALAELDADVVGLMEIENAEAALADLVSGLNDEPGAGTYQAIETGPIGPDEIRVALIYKPDALTPVGSPAVLDSEAFLDPNATGTPRNRPAVAQTFRDAYGGVVTVVVNHLKSKGSPCGPGDDDPVQGNCNLTRTLAAGILLDWLATDPTGAGDPDVLLLGDYNAYDEEDPMRRLLAGTDDVPGSADDNVDLLEAFGGEYVYTYVFDGLFGHLDYALATATAVAQTTGAAAWHVNADEPDILDYDTTFKPANQVAELYVPDAYRSSDHDPILVAMSLNASPVCSGATADPTSLWPANHQLESGRIVGVTDPEGDPVSIAIDAVYQDEPVDADDDGAFAPDAFIGDGNGFELRAERDGEGDGRVYHVFFTASDATGSCSGVTQVEVAVSRGRNASVIDDGPLYDATTTN